MFDASLGHLININFYVPLKYFNFAQVEFNTQENNRTRQMDMNQFLNYENQIF